MKKIKISVALATYNEEKNIIDCIKSLKEIADEIVVVDGTSSDRTREFSRKLGAKVIETTNKRMFHINKNMAIDSCQGEWILLMDADERVTPKLTTEIKKKISEGPTENGFWINRRNWFLGSYLRKGGAYPDPVIRLFRNGKGRLPEVNVHEQIKIDGKVGHLKNDLLHFADPSFKRYLERADRYTNQTATAIEQKDPGRGIVQIINYMLIKPLKTFFFIYLRHKGYSDGFRGFVWALFSSAHFFYAYVRYWELKTKA